MRGDQRHLPCGEGNKASLFSCPSFLISSLASPYSYPPRSKSSSVSQEKPPAVTRLQLKAGVFPVPPFRAAAVQTEARSSSKLVPVADAGVWVCEEH